MLQKWCMCGKLTYKFLLVLSLVFLAGSARYVSAESVKDNANKEVELLQLEEFCAKCKTFNERDTLLKYSELLLQKAKNQNNNYYMALGYRYRSWVCYIDEDYEKALYYNAEAGSIWDELNDKENLAFEYKNYALVMAKIGRFVSANDYLQRSLKIYIDSGNSNTSEVLRHLAEINLSVRAYDNAIDYYTQACHFDSIQGNVNGQISDYIGMATVEVQHYLKVRNVVVAQMILNNAKRYIDSAYAKISNRNVHEQLQLALVQSQMYVEEARRAQGEKRRMLLDTCATHSLMAEDLCQIVGTKIETIDVSIALANYYLLNGDKSQAIKQLERANGLLETIKSAKDQRKALYLAYRAYYEYVKDYRKANDYASKIYAEDENNRSEEFAVILTQSKVQLKLEDKMRKRLMFEHEQSQKQAEVASRRQTILLLGVFSFMAITIVVVLANKRRKRFSNILKERNAQLQAAKEELSVQNEMLNQANRSITDSIVSARQIQEAAIPTREFMLSTFGDCMVFMHPYDIVSGDFYWTIKVGRYKVLAVADCTGHGVPGAFMSMLGISMLNDIIANLNMNSFDVKASDVLNKLRDNVRAALRQDQYDDCNHDGMDMAILFIDSERQQLQYAGAFRPLVMARSGAITQIEADRMPIGIYAGQDRDFTNHIIDVQIGDTFYLYTDGITDQFNNEKNGRKFSRRRLHELLQNNHMKSFTEQTHIYEDALYNWRTIDKDNPTPAVQTDDILMVGIRI